MSRGGISEEIIDTKQRMDFFIRQFHAPGAGSLNFAGLPDKNERREVLVSVDFVEFTLQDGFVVGYGLSTRTPIGNCLRSVRLKQKKNNGSSISAGWSTI